jgi:hypothetical protein
MEFICSMDGNYHGWFCDLSLKVHSIFEEILSARALKGHVRSGLSRGRGTTVVVIAYGLAVDSDLEGIHILTLNLEIVRTFLSVGGVSEVWDVPSSGLHRSMLLLSRLVY